MHLAIFIAYLSDNYDRSEAADKLENDITLIKGSGVKCMFSLIFNMLSIKNNMKHCQKKND